MTSAQEIIPGTNPCLFLEKPYDGFTTKIDLFGCELNIYLASSWAEMEGASLITFYNLSPGSIPHRLLLK